MTKEEINQKPPMISKYLNPQNDFAFRKIFGQEKNKDILLAMLNSVVRDHLHREIVDVEFLKTHQDPDTAAKKQSIVDVLCRDQDGCQYVIEMQVAYQYFFKERAQYYASKAYIDQAGAGGKYYNLKKVIFLAFTNFSVFPEEDDYKSEHVIKNKKTNQNQLKALNFTFIDLPRFMQQCPQDIEKLSLEHKFYYFLSKAERMKDDELEKLAGQDIVIRKAFKEIDYFNMSEVEQRTYDQEKKRLLDNEAVEQTSRRIAKEEGRKKGRKEGREEGEKIGREKGEKIGREEGEKIGQKKMLDQLVKLGKLTQEEADAMLGE